MVINITTPKLNPDATIEEASQQYVGMLFNDTDTKTRVKFLKECYYRFGMNEFDKISDQDLEKHYPNIKNPNGKLK